MHLQRLCYLGLLLTLVVGALGFHQNSPAAAMSDHQAINALAMAIDNRASMNGLPSGDGVISPAENAISEVIWNDINRFNQNLDAFEQASPVNTAAIDTVEITITDYYVKVFDPASRPDADANAQQSLEQLTNDITNELILQQLTEELTNEIIQDMTRQELLDATEQYLNETNQATPDTLQQLTNEIANELILQQLTNELTDEIIQDLTWQEIIDATEQYLNETSQVSPDALQQLTDEITNELYLEELTRELTAELTEYQIWQELIEATEQYLAENDAAGNPQLVGETIKQGTHDHIQNDGKIKRKNINRKRVENMIEFYVPSQMLPTNGMWRVRPYTATFTGNCDSVGGGIGNGDGYGDNPELENPGEPLCGFENPGGLPFITWQYDMHMYLPGTSSIYSGMPEIGFAASRSGLNGPTTGSQRWERTVEYEVVAPDLVRVHYLLRYSGGCTIEATYELELVTADESVCPDLSSYDPTKGESEPVEIIPGKGPQSIPVRDNDELPIEEPPVFEGPYTAGLPIMPPAASCELPQLTEVRLLDQGSGVLMLDYGTGQQTLYRDGTGFTFDSGFGANGWENISLYFNPDGSGYLTWDKTSTTGQMCNLAQNLYLPGMTPVETPVQPTDSTGDTASDTAPVAGGTLTDGDYAVAWTVMDMTCPADMEPMIPTFANVTVTFTDAGTVVLSYDGGEFVLSDMMGLGTYMYTDTTATPLVTVGLTNIGGMDVQLSWMAMNASGGACSATATFSTAE